MSNFENDIEKNELKMQLHILDPQFGTSCAHSIRTMTERACDEMRRRSIFKMCNDSFGTKSSLSQLTQSCQ